MTVALILAGHGSQISPRTAGIVWHYADTLRKQGIAEEITVTFWKEQPEFSQVLKTVTSDTIVVVPIFTSSGYFARQVIPSEMGLDGAVTHKDGCTIYLTRTIGEHPTITDITRKRINNVIENENFSPEDSVIAIIGHGTKRSKTTKLTIQSQVEILREDIDGQILEAYLDDEPNIPSIFERTDKKNIIAVPFFLAMGSHVSIDVPDAFGIKFGDYPANVQKRTLFYTPPIGTDDAMIQVIIDLIQECGIEIETKASSEWNHLPQVGADILLEVLGAENSLTIGQLEINSDVVSAIDSTQEIILSTPSEIRAHVRENPFRPLASSQDLPLDWLVPIEHPGQIPSVVETVYPGILADWSAQVRGDFSTETLSTMKQGQQDSVSSNDASLPHFVNSVCGRCIKYPAWYEQDTLSETIVCSTPCNLLLSTIKEAINDG